MTLKLYKCACAKPHLHKISNLTKKIISTGQFTFDYKVLKRYMIQKIVKQGIIWLSNMQIRYFKDLCEPCLNAPENVEIVEALNEHFASAGERVAAQIENISINLVDAINKANTKFKFKSIEVCQISKIIKKMVNGKTVGIHSLPKRSLKEGVDLIASSLCAIFNRAIYTKTYPSDLNIAKVSALYLSLERRKTSTIIDQYQ